MQALTLWHDDLQDLYASDLQSLAQEPIVDRQCQYGVALENGK